MVGGADGAHPGVGGPGPEGRSQIGHGTRARVGRELHRHPGQPSAAAVMRIVEMIDSDEMLLFATDYPHWQFEGDRAVPDGLPASFLAKMLTDNPLATYPRLKEKLT